MKNKNKNIKRNIPMFITNSLLCIASIVMSIILTKHVIELDMLPNKFFIMYIVGISLINLINIIFIIPKKIVFNIISIILSVVLIVGSGIAVHHINNIDTFLEKAFNNIEYELTNYSVVVLNDSDYKNLEDLDNKSIGYVTLDSKKNEYANLFEGKVNVELKEYDNSYVMYEDLTKKRINAMIIDDIYLEFLKDEDSKIEKKIEVIYTFEIKDEVGKTHNDYTNELKTFNILITGSDARLFDRIQSKTRSDVNMIMTVNPNTHEILLTSIPRDYYVQLHGTTGVKDKLTHSGIYGMNMTKTTIEDLLDIRFDYVVKVGFGTVINVVDTIGGIDVYSDREFNSYHMKGWTVPKGMVHMNGKQALSYARERYAYPNGDNHRVQNQQQVLEAIFTKAMTDKSLLSKYEDVLNSLRSLYVTDIPSLLIKRIVKQQLSDMKSWKIARQQLSGTGKMGVETYSMPGWKLWVMLPDDESVKKNSENINNMINGKSLKALGF